MPPTTLALMDDTDRSILDLEASWWKFPAAKEARATEELGLSPTRYAQRLNLLLDDPAAEAHAPVLVHRLRRLRDARRARRSSRPTLAR